MEIGRSLGRYQILEEIGRGGMATVYKALDTELQRTVALKVLPEYFRHDAILIQRFKHEAIHAAKLDHPNIVTIYDVGEDEGLLYFAMEYVDGQPLSQLIHERGSLPLSEAVGIIKQVACALDHAHAQGYFHRDVKPSNVLIGKTGQAFLTDFGIVKAAEGTSLTTKGSMIGTPQYMSPEQVKGLNVDRRTDIYSLGVVCYEMLAGKPPFRGDTARVLHAHVYERPAPLHKVNPRVPPAAGQVVERALAKKAGHRYGTAGEMARALGSPLVGKMVEEPTTMVAPAARRPGLSPPVLIGTLVAVVVLISVIVIIAQVTHQPTPISPALATSAAAPSVSPTPDIGVARTAEAQEPVVQSTATASSMPTNTPSLTPIPPTVTSRPMIAATSGGWRIAFVSDRDSNNEIYVMNADHSNQVNLTHNPAADEHPSWSPDGTLIALTSKREGNFEIYTMTADGSGPRNLTHNPSDDWGPSWSPDGTRIAYMSWRDDNNEIYIVDTGGTMQTRLTHNQTEDHWPSWSPEGTRLAFMSNRDGNWEIYVMNSDGRGQSNLTRNWAADFYPSWSPDATSIAFVSDRDGNDEVYVMNSDGNGATNLSNNPADDWAPSWSPDGRHIVFVSNRDRNDEIYIMNDDGSKQVRLTNNWPANDWDPVW